MAASFRYAKLNINVPNLTLNNGGQQKQAPLLLGEDFSYFRTLEEIFTLVDCGRNVNDNITHLGKHTGL